MNNYNSEYSQLKNELQNWTLASDNKVTNFNYYNYF